MPAPETADDFLSVVAKSKLVPDEVLADYRRETVLAPGAPGPVADRMLRAGLLTPFQVELLLNGKSRPFFLGPYKVLSRIGNGSMGVVYLCEHRDMRRKVAVKVLQGRRARDEASLQRFLREAQAAAALNHPNVVHAVDLAQDDTLHYLVMEYVNGVSLKQLVQMGGPIPPGRAADYLRQAAMGLQHAHEAGLIHRDIKPSNLMIDQNGVLKLLDLGLARFAEDDTDLTRGAVLGSVGYVAPEQILDSHTVDARADIYSLGATFYLALTGRAPPVSGLIEGPPAPHPGHSAAYSQVLGVVRRMMALDPQDRFPTAWDVAMAVTPWAVSASAAADDTVTLLDDGNDEAPPGFTSDEVPLGRPDQALPSGSSLFEQLCPPVRNDDPKLTHPPKASRPGRGLGVWHWAVAVSAAVLLGLLLAVATNPGKFTSRAGPPAPVSPGR